MFAVPYGAAFRRLRYSVERRQPAQNDSTGLESERGVHFSYRHLVGAVEATERAAELSCV